MSDWRVRAVRASKRPFSRPAGGSGPVDTQPAPEHSMDPRPDQPVEPVTLERSVVDAAVYRDGRRIDAPANLADIYRELPDRPGAMAWIGLYRPAEAQLLEAADRFNLHELAVEDAIVAHQRPKLERYGDTLFVVLRAARYLDEAEEVDFGEIHLFVGPDFVLTVRHSQAPDLSAVRRRLETDPDLLALGPEAVLYAVLDAVVDGYAPVIAGLQHDIDEIETEVFGGDPQVSRRIYELSREVIEAPAGDPAAAGDHEEPGGGLRQVRHRRRAAALPARRRRPRHLRRRAGGRLPADAAEHPDRERDAGLAAAERGDEAARRGRARAERRDQEDLLLGGDPLRADADRHRLRDELRDHAGGSSGRSATRSRSG